MIGIIFPHQLFEQSVLINQCDTIYMIEEYLFFTQYKFHQQKIAFHRASMKSYEQYLLSLHKKVIYVNAQEDIADIRQLIDQLQTQNITEFAYIDTTDYLLEKRISQTSKLCKIGAIKYNSSLFLNTPQELNEYYESKKKLYQTDFYKQQRIQRNILLEQTDKPLGGKWTFDTENRLKYPKKKVAPTLTSLPINEYYAEAIPYTQQHFANHYGIVNTRFLYPTTFTESKAWLQIFLATRFAEFGEYEDAMVANEIALHHSLLTPMLNVGLLTPQYIIDCTLQYASENEVGLNSVEGFIRQIIGWREFIRMVYQLKGTEERTKNYWGFTKKIPESFWNGTTGIEPVDKVIKRVLETGYCHHIERLMVLGNFMLLCEFDPNEVYKWFMELFIDAYDWVMVPNVYGMSQFADGGLMATKPYISGSNYILKMSDFAKGDWQASWDGLFWRFMDTHRTFFLSNPRLGMLVHMFDKIDISKREKHLAEAEKFMTKLAEGN
jgi:deoxyribodipyrimidine photolyase-related protein